MYSELQTESKEEALRFLADHLEHEIANITVQRTDETYTISVGSGIESPVISS